MYSCTDAITYKKKKDSKKEYSLSFLVKYANTSAMRIAHSTFKNKKKQLQELSCGKNSR